jgi:hypothetical protein
MVTEKGLGDIFIVFAIGVLIIVCWGIASTIYAPSTVYKITANSTVYYTDKYETNNGFITINEYYLGNLLPYRHFVNSTTLQGNIKIENNK